MTTTMTTSPVFPIAATLGAIIFATLVLKTLFRHMTPKTVESDYRACNGGWEEAILSVCDPCLLAVPQQPRNTYSNLAYIAAEGFGNDKPGDQRALAALLALTHLSRTQRIDGSRRYIGGMSGGGKMASQVLTLFPAFFDGALCIVGANPIRPDARLAPQLAGKRVVFMTGSKDFNHYDVVAAYKQLVAAGLAQAHLIDLPAFGHQYPDAEQLEAALDLLDPRPGAR